MQGVRELLFTVRGSLASQPLYLSAIAPSLRGGNGGAETFRHWLPGPLAGEAGADWNSQAPDSGVPVPAAVIGK